MVSEEHMTGLGVKVDPVAGMPVTWIFPSEDPENAQFIQTQLIDKYGRNGLAVLATNNTSCGYTVTLTQDGVPIPSQFCREHKTFSWHYLRPL